MVFDHKTVFMQRIADYVRLGYRYWLLTEVRIERAWALAQKFRRLYEVHLHRNQRARARANGEGSAYALWWQPHADSLAVCLLVTPGSHAAHRLEHLRDATQKEGRITVGDYELIRHQRAGSRSPSWTWQLAREALDDLRIRVIHDIRRGVPVDVIAAELASMPGFAGVRIQAKKLKTLLHNEQSRRGTNQKSALLKRIPYIQRVPNVGLHLSDLSTAVQLKPVTQDTNIKLVTNFN